MTTALTSLDQLLFDAATRHRSGELAVTWFTHLGRMPVLAALAVGAASTIGYRRGANARYV